MTNFRSPNYNARVIQPMSFDSLRRAVPSAFAERPYNKVSDTYQYIPTYPLIEALQAQGYQPIKAYESRTRIDEKRGFTKHLIRFVAPDMKLPGVGDTFQGLVLTNAHDATAAYHVYDAIWRLICSNGMVSQTSKEDVIRIRHSARAIEQLHAEHAKLLVNAKRTAQEVEDFSVIDLTEVERGIFARAALDLRWAPEEQTSEDGQTIKLIETAPIKSEALLNTRRSEDRAIANSLWGTLNIAQENLMQGGLRGRNANGGRTTTREIKSVDTDVKLNKALWRLAQEMRALKQENAA